MSVDAISRATAQHFDFEGEWRLVRAPLASYAYRLTGNEVERDDLVQETLYRAWKSRHLFTTGTSFKAWLLRIARNTFISGARRRKRQVDMIDEEIGARLKQPPQQEATVHMQDLGRAMARLPGIHYFAILALEASEGGYDVAASALGIPVGTFRSRIHRARASIVDLMDDRSAWPDPVQARSGNEDEEPGPSDQDRPIYAAWKLAGCRLIG